MSSPLVSGDPRQLGDYWLAGRLGAGGQGVVYEAYDAKGERVAIKSLHGAFSGDGQREMLAREIEAVARVSPFCTARVLASDLTGTPPYVVSEYVPGPDLQHAVDAGGALGPGELYRLAIGIATALVAVHRAGIVHRDLKPGNVLLGPDGPRVIDFGIARSEDMTHSATGLKGTPRYMAPEIFAGRPASEASDVWAWGAVILFAGVGRPPFEGDTVPQIAHATEHTEPEVGGLAEPLRSAVAAALTKDPAERPSAHRLLLDLVGGNGETGRLLAEGSRAAADMRAPRDGEDPSLADRAEAAYQRLDPAAREATAAVLLRMVLPGEGADDTLRRAVPAEFDDTPATRQVLDEFTRAGLLVREDGQIAIGSAALLRAWLRLRDWVDAERGGLAAHRSLADAARLWGEHGRRSGDLLQGSALQRAVQWAATGRRHLTLNAAERTFLEACASLTRRRARLRRALTAGLAVLLVAAVSAAGIAVRQTHVVSAQRDKAVADRLAVLASSLRRDDPRTSRRLALAAARIEADDQTRQAEQSAMYQWENDAFAPNIGGDPAVPALTPDGRTAIIDDGVRMSRWDLTSHDRMPMTPSALTRSWVTLSPDDRHMAQKTKDGVQIYDAASGKPIGKPLGGPGRPFGYLRYSASGNLLMADSGPPGSSLPRGVKPEMALWDTRDGRLVGEWHHDARAWAVSADERYVAMALPSGFQLWDTATRKPVPTPWLKSLRGDDHEPVRQVAFGPHGAMLALVTGTHAYTVNLNAGEALTHLTSESTEAATFTGVPRHSDVLRGLDAPVFSPDGRFLAVGFTLWEIDGHPGGTPLMDRRLAKGEDPVDCRFSADGDIVRCATTFDRVVATNIGGYTGRVPAASSPHQLALSPFGDRAAILASDGVSIWDVRSRRVSGRLPVTGSDLSDVVFSPDGGLLAVAEKAPKTGYGIWDTRSSRKLAQLDWPPNVSMNDVVTFSPDGRTLAAVVSATGPSWLQLWDAHTGKRTRTIPLKPPPLGAPVYRADGRAVILATGTLDVPSGTLRGRLDTNLIERIMAVSPDGSTAALSARPDSVYLWDLRSDKPMGPALAAVSNQSTTGSPPAAFSPDGRLAAVGDAKGNIHLFDVGTGRQFALNLPGHADGVDTLAFSRDGSTLFSTGGDQAVQSAVLDTGRIGARLCVQVGALTRVEWHRYVPELPYRSTCP